VLCAVKESLLSIIGACCTERERDGVQRTALATANHRYLNYISLLLPSSSVVLSDAMFHSYHQQLAVY